MTKEQMDAFSTLTKMGFKFSVHQHSALGGGIVGSRMYESWPAAYAVFEYLKDGGTPCSISASMAANKDKVVY